MAPKISLKVLVYTGIGPWSALLCLLISLQFSEFEVFLFGSWPMQSQWIRRMSETPATSQKTSHNTPPICYCNTPLICIAVLLMPLRSEEKEILSVLLPVVSQYASHLYCNTPLIRIAVLLGNLGGCGHRDVPQWKTHSLMIIALSVIASQTMHLAVKGASDRASDRLRLAQFAPWLARKCERPSHGAQPCGAIPRVWRGLITEISKHWAGSPNKSINHIGKCCPKNVRKLCLQPLWTIFGQFFRHFSDILSAFPLLGCPTICPLQVQSLKFPNVVALNGVKRGPMKRGAKER